MNEKNVLIEALQVIDAASEGQERRLVENLLEFLSDIALCKTGELNAEQKILISEGVEGVIYQYAHLFRREDIMFILDGNQPVGTGDQMLANTTRLCEEIVVEIIRYLKKSFGAQYITQILALWQKNPFWKNDMPQLENLKKMPDEKNPA